MKSREKTTRISGLFSELVKEPSPVVQTVSFEELLP